MKVAVVGGTGVLGRAVVETLLAGGDEPVVLSRKPAAAGPAASAEHRAVDLGANDDPSYRRLVEALAGAEAVIDAANPDSRGGGAARVLVDGNRRLLAAERDAGIGHHVAISIIGCDRIPYSYYRVKVEQEKVVRDGGVPWSLLRASQFHDLLDMAFRAAARLALRPVASAPVQPIDVRVVAGRLVEAAQQAPGGDLPEVAGPEVRSLGELSKTWARVRGRRLLPLPIPLAGKAGRALKDGALCNEVAAAGGANFETWLRGH